MTYLTFNQVEIKNIFHNFYSKFIYSIHEKIKKKHFPLMYL